MRHKVPQTPAMSELEQLKAIMEEVSPREPHIRIYRVIPETKKHKFLGTAGVNGFSLDDVREWHGGGTFLLRTVRSDGKYGPSRVVRIASLPLKRY